MIWEDYGWNADWQDLLISSDPTAMAGRVVSVENHQCTLITPQGMHRAFSRTNPVATGDWVLFKTITEPVPIEHILVRRTQIKRRCASGDSARVLASNMDKVWILTSMNRDFNPSRLERYLTLAYDSGATPLIILTKTDLDADPESYLREMEVLAPGVDVVALSALTGSGLHELDAHLLTGQTVALLGSSGVGKSTLINRLLTCGTQATGAIRQSDQRGRHTTTRRQLFLTTGGVILMDTPGMRSLGIVADQDTVNKTFADIEELAKGCRYRDCSHQVDRGCAVALAVERGQLKARRLSNYHKLQKEAHFRDRAATGWEARQEKLREKALFKSYRQMVKR